MKHNPYHVKYSDYVNNFLKPVITETVEGVV